MQMRVGQDLTTQLVHVFINYHVKTGLLQLCVSTQQVCEDDIVPLQGVPGCRCHTNPECAPTRWWDHMTAALQQLQTCTG